MIKIKRYKLKDGITKEQLLNMGVEEANYFTFVCKGAVMGKGYCVDIHFAYQHTGKNGKTKQIRATSEFDIDIAFTENIQDWNDFDNVLVLDSDFGQPYYPFYDYINGKYKDIQDAPNTMPYLIKEYNDFMDSLEFLEEIKEDINEKENINNNGKNTTIPR